MLLFLTYYLYITIILLYLSVNSTWNFIMINITQLAMPFLLLLPISFTTILTPPISTPIITYRSKDDADAVGIEGLRQVCEAVQIPVVSIGGVNAQNAGETIEAGAGKNCNELVAL